MIPDNEPRRSTRTKDSNQNYHEWALHRKALLDARAKVVPKARAKRQKTTQVDSAAKPAVTRRRRKGPQDLDGVADLPLDVLLEIFKHVSASDLLNLARSTKALRAIVLTRGISGSIWKEAIANVEPPVPEDLLKEWDPLKLAGFLFTPGCLDCGKSDSADTPVFTFHVEGTRLCNECLTKSPSYIQLENTGSIPRDIFGLLFRYYHRRVAQRMQPFVHRPTYERYTAEFDRISGDATARKAYVAEKEKSYQKAIKIYHSLLQWEYAEKRWRRGDVDRRRNKRRQAYKTRLADMGYRDEVARLPTAALETLPGFKGTKPLTDSEWKRLQPNLAEIMDAIRVEFARKNRNQILGRRCYTLRTMYDPGQRNWGKPVPDYQDIANAEPFRSLIFDSPLDETVAEPQILPLMDRVPRIVEEWNQKFTDALLEVLPQEAESGGSKKSKGKKKEVRPDASVLQRATTLFTCASCPAILSYPGMFIHKCFREKTMAYLKQSGSDEDAEGDDEGNGSIEGEGIGQEFTVGDVVAFDRAAFWARWCEEEVELDEDASVTASVLVALAGLDPATATMGVMDDLDGTRFECLRCRKPRSKVGRLVMTWRHAIAHEFEAHPEDESTCDGGWRVLSQDEFRLVKAKEAKQAPDHRRYNEPQPFLKRPRPVKIGPVGDDE